MACFKPPYLRMGWKGSDIHLPRRAEHPFTSHPPLTPRPDKPPWSLAPPARCFLLSSQPHKHQDHTPAWSQGRPGTPTLYRAAACAFVRSAVRSSSGLPSFREGLGPKTCRDEGRPRFQGFLGTYHVQPPPPSHPYTHVCTKAPGRAGEGSVPGYQSLHPKRYLTLSPTKASDEPAKP